MMEATGPTTAVTRLAAARFPGRGEIPTRAVQDRVGAFESHVRELVRLRNSARCRRQAISTTRLVVPSAEATFPAERPRVRQSTVNGATGNHRPRRGRLRRALRWKSPLRTAIRLPAYFSALIAGSLIGATAGDAQLGFDIGLIVGGVVPDAIASWLDHRGALPIWARQPAITIPSPPPGMGIYSTSIPEDEYGPVYVRRADQAALLIWLKRRRARAQHRQSEQNVKT